jgi:hypothetical protein
MRYLRIISLRPHTANTKIPIQIPSLRMTIILLHKSSGGPKAATGFERT